MDRRDHLILALCALLRAERQTRAAFEAVVAAGRLSRETLRAILIDPVPVTTQDDLMRAERLAEAA